MIFQALHTLCPQRQFVVFSCLLSVIDCSCRKINELEEELKVVGNNMKALEIAEQEVDKRLRSLCIS